MAAGKDAIRTYNLFGETAELPDVVHCETIETRSRRHNWELRPHRHAHLHQFLVIRSGGGRADLDGRQAALAPGMVVSIPAGHVHGFSFDRGTAGWVITLASDLLDESLRPGEGLRPLLQAPHIVPAPRGLTLLTRRLLAEHAGQGFARAQVLRSLAGLMTGLVARAVAERAGRPESPREHPLFRRFEALVEAQFRRRVPVAGYAAQLAVSPAHLNRIVRQATGGPASRLIAERTLREARRLLSYTNLPVARIGYELGYADPAHFSRVFTRGTGCSPRAFRQRLERRARPAPVPESIPESAPEPRPAPEPT